MHVSMCELFLLASELLHTVSWGKFVGNDSGGLFLLYSHAFKERMNSESSFISMI